MNINIVTWNVNGIRAISKKNFYKYIKDEKPDILCLQETKAVKEQLDEKLLNIEGYNSYFSTPERKGYSGVAIYSKVKPNLISYIIDNEEFDKEGRVIIADYEKFILFNVYFPNGRSNEVRLDYKLRFYDYLLEKINKYKTFGKEIIICGDFNTAHMPIDLKNDKANKNNSGFLLEERIKIDEYINNGLMDIFRKLNPKKVVYSWWSYRFNARKNNAGWRIDYFLITQNLFKNVKDIYHQNEVLGSDHCPIVLKLEL